VSAVNDEEDAEKKQQEHFSAAQQALKEALNISGQPPQAPVPLVLVQEVYACDVHVYFGSEHLRTTA